MRSLFQKAGPEQDTLQRLAQDRGWRYLGACPICDSRFTLVDVYREHLALCRCDDCHVLFLNPRPVSNDYRTGHLHGRYLPRLREKGLVGPGNEPQMPQIYGAYRRLADMAKEVHRGGRVVDVGCAIGLSMLAMRHLGIESSGIDIHDEFVTFARDEWGLDVQVQDVLEPAEQRAELVTLNATLEHIADPVGFLTGIRKQLMEPGGRLIVTVPNALSLQFLRDGGDWDTLNGGHFWYFTERTLIQTGERAGLALDMVWPAKREFTGDMHQMERYVRMILGLDVNLTGGMGVCFLNPAGRFDAWNAR